MQTDTDGRGAGTPMAETNLAGSSSSANVMDKLEVHSGDQAGSSMSIAHHNGFTVGTDHDNDIVLRCRQADPVRMRVDYSRGKRRIKLIEGSVSVAGDLKKIDQYCPLPDGATVAFCGVSFTVSAFLQAPFAGAKSQYMFALKSVRNMGAMMAIVVGSALLVVMLLQDNGMADTELPSPLRTLQEHLDELGFDNLEVVKNENTGLTVVQGRVSTREQLHQIGLLRAASQDAFTLDAQIDALLMDSIEDVYRNHGISAVVEVIDKGHVRVETRGADEITLSAIEEALRSDLPMLKEMEIVNIEDDAPEIASQSTMPDPAKDVEAVVAGRHPYVITRDQARYFVGAVLPSGHTIASISEGTVVVLRNGDETRLTF